MSDDSHRSRLLAALADAVSEQEYSAVTVAEIVRRARVSRRTFYEHFATKEACLVALYDLQSRRVIAEIEGATQGLPSGDARLVAGIMMYLSSLQGRQRVVQMLFWDVAHAGPEGIAMRRRVMRRFAALIERELRESGVTTSMLPMLATALVGGINELVLEAVEEERADRLTELAGAVTALLRPFFQMAAVNGVGSERGLTSKLGDAR